MAACGGGGSDALTSINEKIAVTPVDGYVAEVNESLELITVRPEGTEGSSIDYIEIEAPGPDGSNDGLIIGSGMVTGEYQYSEDAAYSMEMLEADMNTLIAENGDTYSNLEKVTLGDYDYMRVECTTNGSPAYRYVTVLNEKPYTVTVISGKVMERDSDEVNDIISSIVFK